MVFTRLIVAITGASGAIYAKEVLEVLRSKKVETHVIVSKAAEKVIEQELEITKKDIEKLGDHAHDVEDLTAPMMSGSFKTDGMMIIPCSMKTLAAIAHGYSSNLILRAADVTLKEKRKLVIVPRETPLSAIHLSNMLELAKYGAIIVPAMPAYYHKPRTLDDVISFVVGRVLENFGVEHALYKRWKQN